MERKIKRQRGWEYGRESGEMGRELGGFEKVRPAKTKGRID